VPAAAPAAAPAVPAEAMRQRLVGVKDELDGYHRMNVTIPNPEGCSELRMMRFPTQASVQAHNGGSSCLGSRCLCCNLILALAMQAGGWGARLARCADCAVAGAAAVRCRHVRPTIPLALAACLLHCCLN
jgi:hypothetical protein